MDALFLYLVLNLFLEVSLIELTAIASEIHTASKKLAKGIDVLFSLAKENAEAERNYRSALAKEIVKLKQEGMQTTLIPDIARGNQSDLKYIRDIAEFKYQSGREMLKAIQTQISALQTVAKYASEL